MAEDDDEPPAAPPRPPAPPRPAPLVAPPPLSEAASADAPFLFFDAVPAFAHGAGVIAATLAATRLLPAAPGRPPGRDLAIVAHLRMGIPAALALRDALDKALLLARRPAGAAPDRPN